MKEKRIFVVEERSGGKNKEMMLTQDGADNMEEKTWIISKKGDKLSSILLLFVGGLVLVPLIYLVSGICLFSFTPLILFTDVVYISLFLFAYYILKVTGNWDNPKIITVKTDKIIIEEKFPDGQTRKDIIPIEGIRKIQIDKKETFIEFLDSDGVPCRWYLVWRRYSCDDRKKLEEVIKEILKRVNKKEVEIKTFFGRDRA